MKDIIVAPVEPEVITPGTPEHRASVVLEQIGVIRENLVDGMFDLADLLAEAREKQFNTIWGYTRFGDWVEEGSGLDMSERTAYYLINIVTNAKLLGITREELVRAKMSKLKEIFTLDTEKHGDAIKLLVAAAEKDSLEEIKMKVQKYKVGAGGETYVYITIKVSQSVRDNYIRPAFELVRKQYGDAKDPATGDPVELSDGKCLEFISVAYTQDKNNQEEPGEELPEENG